MRDESNADSSRMLSYSSLIPKALIPYDVVRGLPNIQAMKMEII